MKPIETVAVIGAGRAGRAFALRCAHAGFRVVLEDVMPEKLRRAADEYQESSSDTYAATGGTLRFALTVEEAVREADMVIDFVPDELESKLEIFSMLDRMAPPHTIILSPTDALSITDLASCTYRAEFCLGVRQSLLGDEVTLIRSRFLADEVGEAALQFFTKLGVSAQVIADAEEPMLVKNLGT